MKIIIFQGELIDVSAEKALVAGHEVLRITAALVQTPGQDACIWALAALRDGSLVSGSSRGVTQLWEPQFGTLLSSFQQHQADVLCVATAPDSSRVFSAGMDPTIAMFERQRGRQDHGEHRKIHRRDETFQPGTCLKQHYAFRTSSCFL